MIHISRGTVYVEDITILVDKNMIITHQLINTNVNQPVL
jgi:hypothetical protein